MRGGRSSGGRVHGVRRERDQSPCHRRRSISPPMRDRRPGGLGTPPRDRHRLPSASRERGLMHYRHGPSPPRERDHRGYYHGRSPPRERDPGDYHHGHSPSREREPMDHHHGRSSPYERDPRDYHHGPSTPRVRDPRGYNYSPRRRAADLQEDRDGYNLGHLHKASRPIIRDHGLPNSSDLPAYHDNHPSNNHNSGPTSSYVPRSPVRGINPSGVPILNSGSGMTHMKYGWTEVLRAQEEGLRNTFDEPNKEFARSAYYGASSSGAFAKGAPYRDHHNIPPEGFSLDRDAYRTAHLSTREEPTLDFKYDGLSQRSRVIGMDDLHRIPFGGGNMGPQIADSARDLVHGADPSHASPKNMNRKNFWQEDYELGRDHYVIKGIQKNYQGGYESVRTGTEMRSSGDHLCTHFEDDNEFRRDLYKEQPAYADHRIDAFRRSMSLPRASAPRDDIHRYDQSPPTSMKRRYSLDRDFDHNDSVVRDTREQIDIAEGYRDKAVLSPTADLSFGSRRKKGPFARLSGREVGRRPHDASSRARGGHGLSLNRRLKPAVNHSSYATFKRRPGLSPQKSLKKDLKDKKAGSLVQESDVPEDGKHLVKKDPPEDSEEFKKQVHKAFLRFVKVLYGSPYQQKKYRKPEKDSILDCCVCGSLLKKHFADTHDLVAHTFNCQRPGLRTEHLGLHKALCVLMGWNWLIAPDVSTRYQSGTPELNALKEDLILWPPIVIIHNSSVGTKNDTGEPKIITNECLENLLAGMGFETSKFDVCRGKPANQSMLLVKFKATLSGLQEAERLHKQYADNSRGRKEFKRLASSKDRRSATADTEELLYGYIATVEDLEKLDVGTKKICMVRSKKDIEAIADAPLDTD